MLNFYIRSFIMGGIILVACLHLLEDYSIEDSEPSSVITGTPIDLATLLYMRKNPHVLVIDIRDADIYGKGHIPGAINWTSSDMGNELVKDIKMAQAPNIILYAGGQSIADVNIEQTVIALKKYGYKNVLVFSPGWEQWKSTGLPKEFAKNE